MLFVLCVCSMKGTADIPLCNSVKDKINILDKKTTVGFYTED